MFQRKSEFQAFAPQGDPVPQTGTILPPLDGRGWENDFTPTIPTPRQPVVDATIVTEETIISADLTIIGNVISKGRVKLEGTIEGDMNCRSLVVGEQGSVTGGITAQEVSVYGRVAGTVRGCLVNLYATAHVEGDIYHHGIGIEMGTHYDGRLKWTDSPEQAGESQSSLPHPQGLPQIPSR